MTWESHCSEADTTICSQSVVSGLTRRADRQPGIRPAGDPGRQFDHVLVPELLQARGKLVAGLALQVAAIRDNQRFLGRHDLGNLGGTGLVGDPLRLRDASSVVLPAAGVEDGDLLTRRNQSIERLRIDAGNL